MPASAPKENLRPTCEKDFLILSPRSPSPAKTEGSLPVSHTYSPGSIVRSMIPPFFTTSMACPAFTATIEPSEMTFAPPLVLELLPPVRFWPLHARTSAGMASQ